MEACSGGRNRPGNGLALRPGGSSRGPGLHLAGGSRIRLRPHPRYRVLPFSRRGQQSELRDRQYAHAGVFGFIGLSSVYDWILTRCALVTLPSGNWGTWLFAFVFYDLCYYWQHRLGHTVGLFWASHSVHHQSEEFNLTTALRQPGTGAFRNWLFYVPMAFMRHSASCFPGYGCDTTLLPVLAPHKAYRQVWGPGPVDSNSLEPSGPSRSK